MGKKKRSAEEAGLIAVEAEGTSASAVGLPTEDAGSVSMDVDVVKKDKKSKKDKSSSKDKEGKEKKASKKEKASASSTSTSKVDKEKDLEIPAEALSAIARPLAGRKLSKKVLKTVKKGQKPAGSIVEMRRKY